MTDRLAEPWPAPPAGAGGPAGLRAVPDLPAVLGVGLLAREAAVDQDLVCRRKVRVTHDVATLVLEPTRPELFAFTPGQYLTLGVDLDGGPVERRYTISSPPTRPHLLSVTVKRVPGGELSPWLHDHLAPGDRLRARGPLGGFSVVEHPSPRYLLLSTGSGITPTLSTLRTISDLAEPVDVVVVHSARTPADLVCRAELDALAGTHDGLRVVWLCESDAPGEPWQGPRGRLDARLLRGEVPDVVDREVFTCGPPGYMAAARTVLAELGVEPWRCHEESFVLDLEAPVAAAPADGPVVPVVPATTGEPAEPWAADEAGLDPVVRFGRSGREVPCPPGTTVLAAATRAGGPAALLVRLGHVRHLQVHVARGQGGHEARRRHPPA